MNRKLKPLIIIICIVVAIILIDSIQAKIFDNSPLLKIREYHDGGTTYYIDKGLIVNHYYCSNKQEKTLFKGTKFICPIDELELMNYIGKWYADGTQFKAVISMDSNGKPVYADDYDEPYILTINPDFSYLLQFNDKSNREEKGIYNINLQEIIFTPNNNGLIWYCKLGNEQLVCNSRASTFEKKISN